MTFRLWSAVQLLQSISLGSAGFAMSPANMSASRDAILSSDRSSLRGTRRCPSSSKTLNAHVIRMIDEIRKEIEHFCDLGARVIDQSRRRVLNGEQVPTAEKIYSIFEPHTDLIKRGKVQTPIEFGHKVFLAESARGLITQYEVLDGNPVDEQHVVASLERHKQTFGHVPKLYGSDRGFFSEKNVTSCKKQGVKVVCIPQRGGSKAPEREAYEKSREFKDGQRFRAGIEGRISVLFRGRGMAQGRERFELWVAAAVLANNLMKIAALLADRSSRRRKAAWLSRSFARGKRPPQVITTTCRPTGEFVKSRQKSSQNTWRNPTSIVSCAQFYWGTYACQHKFGRFATETRLVNCDASASFEL